MREGMTFDFSGRVMFKYVRTVLPDISVSEMSQGAGRGIAKRERVTGNHIQGRKREDHDPYHQSKESTGQTDSEGEGLA